MFSNSGAFVMKLKNVPPPPINKPITFKRRRTTFARFNNIPTNGEDLISFNAFLKYFNVF